MGLPFKDLHIMVDFMWRTLVWSTGYKIIFPWAMSDTIREVSPPNQVLPNPNTKWSPNPDNHLLSSPDTNCFPLLTPGGPASDSNCFPLPTPIEPTPDTNCFPLSDTKWTGFWHNSLSSGLSRDTNYCFPFLTPSELTSDTNCMFSSPDSGLTPSASTLDTNCLSSGPILLTHALSLDTKCTNSRHLLLPPWHRVNLLLTLIAFLSWHQVNLLLTLLSWHQVFSYPDGLASDTNCFFSPDTKWTFSWHQLLLSTDTRWTYS